LVLKRYPINIPYLKILVTVVAFIYSAVIVAQINVDTSKQASYIIGSIELKGNKKTKAYIVLREVPFKIGDTLTAKELTEQLVLAKEQIINTTLFIDALVYAKNIIHGIANISIEVKERWYLFPLPYFKLVDRNFNQWWNEQNRSLDRVNYGLKFFHNNFSGRNDKLSLDVVNGYNQQVTFGYNQPFADKTLKHGFFIGFGYNRQRELNYATLNNSQAFVKPGGYVKESYRAQATYSYRPDSRYRFYTTLAYVKDVVADTVLKLNANYFPTNSNNFSYLYMAANLQYFGVDYIPFPKKGFMYDVAITNKGFGKIFNQLSFSAEATKAISLSNNSFAQIHGVGITRFNTDPPFIAQGLMGYGEMYLRGLENYVIDGTASILLNNTLYQKLFSFNFKPPIKVKQHEQVPFTFYAKLFSDFGYVYNKRATPTNTFANTWLASAGAGIDITSIYDFVFRIEYSITQVGTRGFGVRVRGDF
jgi:outer membrane protein assembly factor BamA